MYGTQPRSEKLTLARRGSQATQRLSSQDERAWELGFQVPWETGWGADSAGFAEHLRGS